MFNKRTLAIIKRELRTKLFSKTFILMTFLLPVFMFGVLGFQTLLLRYEGDSNIKLKIVTGYFQLTDNLQKEFDKKDFVKNKNYTIFFETLNRSEFEDQLKRDKKDLLDEKVTGIVYIPEKALENKKVEYYSKNPNNNTIFNKIRSTINKVLVSQYFSAKQLSDKDITFARESVDFSGYRITKEDQIKEEGEGNRILSFLFTFLLYLSLILLGTMMMRSVVEEKNNRIVEVLLSSVNSKELMTGKILGTAITGLMQMAIWLLPVFVVISSTLFILPPQYSPTIGGLTLLYFLFNYFIGLVIFLGLFATVGAIFDNDQDAQSGVWPITILIMIPFFISITLGRNPGNPLAIASSMFPFASIMVMPARMVLVDVPVWQFILSILVNIGTLFLIFPIAGKIYRIGILITGKKPKWSEVIKWVKINN